MRRPSAFTLSASPALQARVLRAFADQLETRSELVPLDLFAPLVELVDEETFKAMETLESD